MGRREISMNEIVEVVYQWHQGSGVKGISRSLGLDRKTVRRYVRLGELAGVSRGGAFPEEEELVRRFRELRKSTSIRERPAQAELELHREWMEEVIKAGEMTAKQVWRLLKERTGAGVSYVTVKWYLRREFQFGKPEVCVRLEVEPGSQAQVDFGYAGMMMDPLSGKERRAWAFIMSLS